MSGPLAVVLGYVAGVASTLLVQYVRENMRVLREYDEHMTQLFNGVPTEQRFDATGKYSGWANGQSSMPTRTRWEL